MKPLIGINADYNATGDRPGFSFVAAGYYDAVTRAGGIPVILPPLLKDVDRRKLLDSEGQNPFAVILGCSDSRIPPEVLFDQGLGDLFVIRVAGNIIDEVVLASIEYAAAHLATPLIVVLGHSKCGAVAATIAGGEPEGHLPALAALIEPAIRECSASQGDLHHNVELANVRRMTNQLREATPILAGLVQDQTLSVIGAYYDQETGLVDWLDD